MMTCHMQLKDEVLKMIEYHESYAIIDKHIERCFNFWRSNPSNTSKEIIQNVYCDLCNLKYDPNTPKGDELDPKAIEDYKCQFKERHGDYL